MNIADILAPKPPPTIDAARVRTHLLGHDDDIPPKEKDMSRATDVADAIAKLGGRATREDLQAATGLAGKQMDNGITVARIAGLIVREGKDYVLTNGAAATPSKQPATAKKKPAAKTKKAAAPKAEKKPRVAAANASTKSVQLAAANKSSSTLDRHRPDPPAAFLLRDGGLLIVDGTAFIKLTQAQYIAVLNVKE